MRNLTTFTTILAAAMLAVAGLPMFTTAAQPADEDPALHNISAAAEIIIAHQFVDVAPLVEFSHATVRISGPEGYALTRTYSAEQGESFITTDLLLDAEPRIERHLGRTDEEALLWSALPDGTYSYELVIYSPDGLRHLENGTFEVTNGNAQQDQSYSTDHSDTHKSNGAFQRIASTLLGIIAPSAHAGENIDDWIVLNDVAEDNRSWITYTNDSNNTWRLGNNSGDFYFGQGAAFPTGQGPAMIIKDTTQRVGIGTETPLNQFHIVQDNGFQLRISATGIDTLFDAFGNWFRIGHAGNSYAQFLIHKEAPTSSLTVSSSGNVGIGTNSPSSALHVSGSASVDSNMNIGGNTTIQRNAFAWLRINNQSSDADWRLGASDTGNFRLTDLSQGSFIDPFSIQNGAPDGSLRINSDGNVGVGTSDPARSFQVHRDDGSARIDITDTDEGPAFQNMFSLTNAGNTQFRMENTATDKVWNFRTQDFDECTIGNTCFVINKRSGPRFRFMEDGDMFIEGAYENSSSRTVKNDINGLDPNDLFERLERVDVYEWSYDHNPDTRHVGPMAEDFYAAFGLGSGEKSISPSNIAGISLAAAQALFARNRELETRLDNLEAKLADTN